MASVLRDPTLLTLSQPVRLRAVGLDKTTMDVYFTDRRDSYDVLYRLEETNLLYSLLSCAMSKRFWQEYFYTDLMLFEWEFNGNTINSCNPYFELLMRCMRKLVIIFNSLSQKKCFPETNDLDILVAQINLAIKGLVHSEEEDDICTTVFQPALYFPPLLRSEHSSAFKKRGTEIAPGISTNTIQMLLYMILAETWLLSLEDSTKKLIVNRNQDLCERIDHLSFYLAKLYNDILKHPHGAVENDTAYGTYIHNRYDTDSVMSDLSRIHLLSKAFTLEKKDIVFHEQTLVSISHSYSSDIFLRLRSVVKLHTKFFLRGMRKPVRIHVFVRGKADNYFASPYEKPDTGDGKVEISKMLTLPNGNIPLQVEALSNYLDDSETDLFVQNKRKKHILLLCFFNPLTSG